MANRTAVQQKKLWPEYREISYASVRIPPELDGWTAAFVTDIHRCSPARLQHMTQMISVRGIDALLLGGDYTKNSRLDGCFSVLSRIRTRDGMFGVEGNHDDAKILRAAMKRHGITLLENTGVLLRPGLYLAGVEDLRNRRPDPEQALEGAPDGCFVLMLSHNPDTTVLCDFSGIDLTLCGHTHGGEITLGSWAPALPLVSSFGQRFRTGWCHSAAGTDVYVSNGIGSHAPFRFSTPAQVIVLTLRTQTFN